MERRVRVFLASPSDVKAEREAARRVVERVNQTVGQRLRVFVDLFGWEVQPPGYGRPQDLLNPQVDDCDVFVGVVGRRWGTPTGAHSSGFEEEYDRALRLRRRSGRAPELWLYLKDVPPGHAADPGPQLQQVLAFHRRVTEEAELLFCRYASVAAWREEFHGHLVDYLVRRYAAPTEQPQPLNEDDPLVAPPSGPQPSLLDRRPALLPTGALTPLDFERLLLDVAREVDGIREVHLYGVPGQRQHGIDLIGLDESGQAHGYQAKRYERFTARNLTDAVEAYVDARRPIVVVRLVIGVATLAERTEILDELTRLRAEHPDVRIELYDRRRLSDLLRDRPEIVRKFFGDSAAERFCLTTTPAAAPAESPPPNVMALADAVMRGPVTAAGVAQVLAEADQRRDGKPGEAAAGYARVEQALETHGFAAHAALVRRRRAAALRAAGRLDEAAALLADSFWVHLDRGDVDEARILLRELERIIDPLPSGAGTPAPPSTAAAPHARLALEALDAAITLVQDPIDRVADAGGAVDELVGQRHAYAGRVAVLFCETALAAEQAGEVASRVTPLRRLATELAVGTEAQRALAVRLRLCLADADGQWPELLEAARRRKLPNDQIALVFARYARYQALQADPPAAEAAWREAVERGCLAGLQEDAAEWLYAQRELHLRYGPIDESLEEPHYLAQALMATGGRNRLYAQRRDPREVGLERLQHDKLPTAADALRRYLRVSLVTGHWASELDAHQLLGGLFARATEPGLALHHLIRAGSASQAREVATGLGDQYIDVAEQLRRPAPWERAVAYQVVAQQGDLVPDGQAPAIVQAALDEIDAIAAGRALDTPHGPRAYLSAHQAIAALAERTDEDQARRLLDRLRPFVPRGPNQYRHTDDAHVDTLVAIATVHPGLRGDALDQLLGLLAGEGHAADRVLVRTQRLFKQHHDMVLPRLQQLTADGSTHAAQALGLLDHDDDQQRQRGRQALNGWAAPRQRRPGVVTYGTNALRDSLLVATLPPTDRASFATRMLDLAVDPADPTWNREEFIRAATNVADDLRPPDRLRVFRLAMDIARGSYPPSPADEPLAGDHPLSRVRITFGAFDLRPLGLQLAAVVARTPRQAQTVQDAALQLLSHGDDTTIRTVARALSQLPGDRFTLDVKLLAAHPHRSLRTLAAIRWAQNPTSDPELGLALAHDPDPRVRRMLGEAIALGPQAEASKPVSEILRRDPRYSVRRSLHAHESE